MTNRIKRVLPLALLLGLALLNGGCKNTLGFSTATKFGLDISQRPDQNIDVSMGYDRTEVASIPVPKNEDATETQDAYSVLGTFEISYDNPWRDEQPLVIRQLFATGKAARKAANSSELQSYFGKAVGRIVNDNGTPAAAKGGQ